MAVDFAAGCIGGKIGWFNGTRQTQEFSVHDDTNEIISISSYVFLLRCRWNCGWLPLRYRKSQNTNSRYFKRSKI